MIQELLKKEKKETANQRMRRISQLKIGLKQKIQTVQNNRLSAGNQLKPDGVENSENDAFSDIPGESNLEHNQEFNDKYEIVKILGHGRNGSVYKCINKETKKYYAVKKMKFEQQHIIFLKQNFYYVKKLNHPSIIKYKSLYFESKRRTSYLVMELFPHKNLNKFKSLPQSQIKNIIFGLFDVIKYLHSRGICHRDIKPENILYDPETENIKLIDFGVGKKYKIRKFKKQLTTPTGTQLYKAPQLINGGIYNQLIDEWAAGVTLYKLIAGFTPFYSQFITQINENIKKIKINFEGTIWEEYQQAKDLILSLLTDANKRISAEQAQKHLWFEKSCKQIQLSSSIPAKAKKRFSHEENYLNLSQKINNDSLMNSIKLDDKAYIKESLLNRLPLVGQNWCYSEQEEEEDTT